MLLLFQAQADRLVYGWEQRKGYNSRNESTVVIRKSHCNNDFGMTSIKTGADPQWVM